MEKISQTKVIYDAFKADIFKDIPKKKEDYPDWYAERMERCENCKYNTKNIPNKFLPISMWVPKAIKQYRCSICTCFIDKKCWSKTEMCGLGETDMRPDYLPLSYIESESKTPKWNRIEIKTLKNDDFDLESLEPEKYNIDITDDKLDFKFDLTPVKKGEDVIFKFRLKPKMQIIVDRVSAACSCTNTDLVYTPEGYLDMTIKIASAGWGPGRATKTMSIMYSSKDNVFKGRVLEFVYHVTVRE